MDYAAFDWQPWGDEFRAWYGEKWIYMTNYDALYGDDEYHEEETDDDDYTRDPYGEAEYYDADEGDEDVDYGDTVYFGLDDDDESENTAPPDDISDIPY